MPAFLTGQRRAIVCSFLAFHTLTTCDTGFCRKQLRLHPLPCRCKPAASCRSVSATAAESIPRHAQRTRVSEFQCLQQTR